MQPQPEEKSPGLRPRDFPWAQAIQYRYFHLPNNGSSTSVAKAAVAANVYSAVTVKLFASVYNVLAEMLTHSHSHQFNQLSILSTIHPSIHPFITSFFHPSIQNSDGMWSICFFWARLNIGHVSIGPALLGVYFPVLTQQRPLCDYLSLLLIVCDYW